MERKDKRTNWNFFKFLNNEEIFYIREKKTHKILSEAERKWKMVRLEKEKIW